MPRKTFPTFSFTGCLVTAVAVGACGVPPMAPANLPSEPAEQAAPAEEHLTVDLQSLLRPPKVVSVLTSGDRSGLCRIAVARLADANATKLADATPEVQEVRRALLERGYTVVASEAGARAGLATEAPSGTGDFKSKRPEPPRVADSAANLQRAEQLVALGSLADAVLIIDDAGTWRRKMRAEVDGNGKVVLSPAGADPVAADCTDSTGTLPVDWYSVGLVARLVSLRTSEPRVVADIAAYAPLGEPLEPMKLLKAAYKPIMARNKLCDEDAQVPGGWQCAEDGEEEEVVTGYTAENTWCPKILDAATADERRTSARPWAAAYRALVDEVLGQVLSDQCAGAKAGG